MKQINRSQGISALEMAGIMVLSICIIILLILPVFLKTRPVAVAADTAWLSQARLIPEEEGRRIYSPKEPRRYPAYPYKPGYREYTDRTRKEHRPVPFDPNKADEALLTAVGLRSTTVRMILNYRAKGGRFRTTEDFKRVYGLFPDEFERLQPYITIETSNDENPIRKSEENIIERKKNVPPVDINKADSVSFERLPGIGPALASRIINFRKKLGGFIKVEQVAETYGLADSVFQKIKPFLQFSPTDIVHIDLNSATVEQLRSHPYIRYTLANAIINFRKIHGNFSSVHDLSRIAAIDALTLQKILPYVVVN